MPRMLFVICRELCSELLSQVALTPSFKHWELSDMEHQLRVDVLQFHQSPTSREY